ncbi:MAG: hypothetical protein ACK4QP_18280 [Pseudorhizobium sp.]
MLRLSQIGFCALAFIALQLAIATGLRVGGWTGFGMAAASILLLYLLVIEELAGVDLKKALTPQPRSDERRKRDRDDW